MTIEKLNQIKKEFEPIVSARLHENIHPCKDGKRIISLCAGTGCQSSKSLVIRKELEKAQALSEVDAIKNQAYAEGYEA